LLPRSSSNGTSIVSTLCVAVASLTSAAVTPPSPSLADPKEDKKKLKKEKKKIDKHIETKIVDLSETDKNLYKLKKEEKSSSRKKGRTRDSYGTEQVSQFIIEDKSDGEKKKKNILKNKNMKNGKITEVGMGDDLDEQNDANEAEGKESSKSRKKKRKSEKVKKAATNNVNELENEIEDGSYQQNGKSKKARKMKKELVLSRNDEGSVEKGGGLGEDEVYQISSGDEDCSRGMKKWITEFHQRRPGVKILQQRIDDFITAHDAQEELARKEREARAAEGGWTVVVHNKGRKKTTDTESGIVVGSVAQAAVMDKMDKKKSKEVGLDFYRFQKREAKRNGVKPGTLVVIPKHGRRIRKFSLGFGALDACLLCDDVGLAELEQGNYDVAEQIRAGQTTDTAAESCKEVSTLLNAAKDIRKHSLRLIYIRN
ncbi:hypothetical protein RJ639_005048, partial [Escallonia herrerae]